MLSDGRIIDVARQVLGGEPVYFGDSSANRNDEAAPVGTFHKDNTDRHDKDAPDWRGDYPVVRFGVYLQDHKKQGGGLLLRAGSHNNLFRNRKVEVIHEEVVDWFTGKTRYVFSEPGDLVVWNLRLTHAGMGRFLRGPIKRPITERTQRIIPRFLHSTVAQARYSMFASFGREGESFERYLTYLKTRRYMVDMWLLNRYDDALVREFATHGGKLLNMKPQIEADMANGVAVGQSLRWQPLPY